MGLFYCEHHDLHYADNVCPLCHSDRAIPGWLGLDGDAELLRAIAEEIHDQWLEWSHAVAMEVSTGRRERWMKECWKPFELLDEEMQELDIRLARKILRRVVEVVKRHG